MQVLTLNSTNPYLNLAIEEYLFLTCEEEVFMLWQNSPTVVIGKNQNAYAEINEKAVLDNGVFVARRITGGGAVYHDLGNINYSFITPNAQNKGIDFATFTTPIITALKNLGVDVSLQGRNDLITNDGKKVSGNAQHRIGDRVLHHGTLLFSSDLTFLDKVLKVDEEKLKSNAVKSTRSRVSNIKEYLPKDLSVKDFIEKLKESIINEYQAKIIDAPTCNEINDIYNRNASKEYIFPEKPFLNDYTLTNKKRYPFGTIETFVKMSGKVIESVKFQGDFFGVKPISELELLLKNAHVSDLNVLLDVVDLTEYVMGISKVELIELITK